MAPDFAQIDLSIAQENMWLETDAQGLGGVWIGIAPMEEWMEEVHKLLELPKEVAVFFPVWRSDIRRKAARRKIASIRSGFIFWSETEFECGREPCQEPIDENIKNGEQYDNSIML